MVSRAPIEVEIEKDIFQARYEAHQKRKAEMFTSKYGTDKWHKYSKKEQETFDKVIKNRCSQRTFNREPVNINEILDLAKHRPSSCDRKAITMKVITSRDEKDLLSGLLVGGVGWCHRADKIILLLAENIAYKAGNEIEFMPYLDAGVLVQNVYLICESRNVGCCYINPNIRKENKELFIQRFQDTRNQTFCGALALGHFDLKNENPHN